MSRCAARTVDPARSPGREPYRYQPTTAGVAGSAISPSPATPTGTTGRSIPSRLIVIRSGTGAAGAGGGVAGRARADGSGAVGGGTRDASAGAGVPDRSGAGPGLAVTGGTVSDATASGV